MSCKNCFNGCTDPVSDKCVKYTGPVFDQFNITTGDTLESVENSILTALQTALNGSGIVMNIDPEIYCAIISGYLPSSGNITLVHYVSALIQTACALQLQINSNTEDIATIEATYNVGCLSGVAGNVGTHTIVQAIIVKLCEVIEGVEALSLLIENEYVKISDIDGYIADYISGSSTSTAIRNRMVPNTVVEYYGTLAHFDGTGAGTGDWEQIYLCNGNNGTPDKRGRSPIGVVTGMGGGAFSPVVDPLNPNNPNYTILSTGGTNVVSLVIGQLPAHTHTATATITDPGHTHDYKVNLIDVNTTGSTPTIYDSGTSNTKTTNSKQTGITVNVTNAPSGNNEGHDNVHPVIACYYIMYKPTP